MSTQAAAMRELTVAAMIVRALLDLAASKGPSRRALAECAHIDLADLQDPDNRVAFSKYVALMRKAKAMCNDPALALHFGEAVDASEVSVAHAFGAAGTIADAITQGNRYAPLGVEAEEVGEGGRFQLCREAGQLWFVDARRNPNDFPELTESTFARMVCSSRKLFGERQVFQAVHVTHAEPGYRAEYERIFRIPVMFGSGRNALQVDEALVSSFRMPASSPYVTNVLRNHADSLLSKLENARHDRERVETILLPLLQRGDVSMSIVANTLCVSRQTLFRKLKAEGVTFERVLDELRRTLAFNYLDANKTSVKETARLVGYSDPAAFSRAFKRWTGSSPSAYGYGSRNRLVPKQARKTGAVR